MIRHMTQTTKSSPTSIPSQSLTEAFDDWLDTAKTGQVLTYYRGFLKMDRTFTISIEPDRVELVLDEDVDKVGRHAMAAFVDGKVHLFQRKVADGVYEYIAMKKSRYGRTW